MWIVKHVWDETQKELRDLREKCAKLSLEAAEIRVKAEYSKGSNLDNNKVEEVIKMLEGFATKKEIESLSKDVKDLQTANGNINELLEQVKENTNSPITNFPEEVTNRLQTLEKFKEELNTTIVGLIETLQQIEKSNAEQVKLTNTCVDTVNSCIDKVKEVENSSNESIKEIINILKEKEVKVDTSESHSG